MRRHNGEPPHRTHHIIANGYRHVARTGIFRVAELDGRIVALACATMRGPLWFLSGFWADPELRLQGIGRPLLREVRDEGARRGAKTFYVWASIDEAAMASYMKLDMLPGTQLFTFAGEPRTIPTAPSGYTTGPLEFAAIETLDRELVGASREMDHAYWTARGFAARVVRRGERLAGFYYVSDAIIGPAGWSSEESGDEVLACALRDAAAAHGTVQLTVPGVNHVALRLALGSGLRLLRTSHLLWSAPIGRMERYVPSGPMLF